MTPDERRTAALRTWHADVGSELQNALHECLRLLPAMPAAGPAAVAAWQNANIAERWLLRQQPPAPGLHEQLWLGLGALSPDAAHGELARLTHPFGLVVEPLSRMYSEDGTTVVGGEVPPGGDVLLGFLTARPCQVRVQVGGQGLPTPPRGAVAGFRMAYLDTFPLPLVGMAFHRVTVQVQAADPGAPLQLDLDLGDVLCVKVHCSATVRRRLAQADALFLTLAAWGPRAAAVYAANDHGGVMHVGRLPSLAEAGARRAHLAPATMLPSMHYDLCAVVRLQRTWRRVCWDPRYRLCRRLRLRDFEELLAGQE